MEFEQSTTSQLKKVIRDLDYEASKYEQESKEHDFLMKISLEIENVIFAWR